MKKPKLHTTTTEQRKKKKQEKKRAREMASEADHVLHLLISRLNLLLWVFVVVPFSCAPAALFMH